jgi:hypothetical protein
MRKSIKFIGALGVAGLIAAGGSAFTSIGVTNNTAAAFVGGTVSQSVTGAALNSIAYTYSDSSNTVITSFAATFAAGADTHAVTTVVTGTTGVWTCTAIGAPTANVSTCTNATPSAGATNVAITVT